MKYVSCLLVLSLLCSMAGLVSIWPQSLRELPRITGPDLKANNSLYNSLNRPPGDRQPLSKPPALLKSKETPLFARPKPEIPSKSAEESRDQAKPEQAVTTKLSKGDQKQSKEQGPFKEQEPSKDQELAKDQEAAKEQESSIESRESDEKNISDDSFPLDMPEYYQGLYLSNYTVRDIERYRPLLEQAHSRGMNVLVVDVQPKYPNTEFIRRARARGFHLVARVVVFDGGLRQYPPSEAHLQKIYTLIERSVKAEEFQEVQLDYIRFTDKHKMKGVALQERYACIEGILKEVDRILKPYAVPWGADLFGRVAFNRNDRIGQKLELFAPYVDTLYPMLYPSHFYGVPQKIRDPYGTILWGVKNSMRRLKKRVQVIAYIQAFRMSIAPSRLSFTDYIYKQLRAAKDAGGAGYVAWNARNRYTNFFKALDKYLDRDD